MRQPRLRGQRLRARRDDGGRLPAARRTAQPLVPRARALRACGPKLRVKFFMDVSSSLIRSRDILAAFCVASAAAYEVDPMLLQERAACRSTPARVAAGRSVRRTAPPIAMSAERWEFPAFSFLKRPICFRKQNGSRRDLPRDSKPSDGSSPDCTSSPRRQYQDERAARAHRGGAPPLPCRLARWHASRHRSGPPVRRLHGYASDAGDPTPAVMHLHHPPAPRVALGPWVRLRRG